MAEDRLCVVSGASRGLGRSIAEHLAGEGYALALCARTQRDLERVAAEIGGRHQVAVVHHAVDVTDATAVEDFARTVSALGTRVSAVVNNAGELGPVGRIDQVSMAAWRRALDVNFMGVVHMTAAFAPQLAASGGGSVVNLLGGGVGGPGVQSHISAYTSSKAAVALLTETVARELAPVGIRVNAVSPGAFSTDLMRPVLDAGREGAGDDLYETAERIFSADAQGEADAMLASNRLIAFLLSDRAAGITGRLLSARWDSVDRLVDEADRIAEGSRYTLRRIDDETFGAITR